MRTVILTTLLWGLSIGAATASSQYAGTATLSSEAKNLATTVIGCATRGGTAGPDRYVVRDLARAASYGKADVEFLSPDRRVVDSFTIVLDRNSDGRWSCKAGDKSPSSIADMFKKAEVSAAASSELLSQTAEAVVSHPVTMHGQNFQYTTTASATYEALKAIPNESPAELEGRLFNAANAFRGTDTAWSGTDNGWRACAAAVQKIVLIATHTSIGSWNVDDWWNLAMKSPAPYGGQFLLSGDAYLARPGDIIIWDDLTTTWKAHIGFCANDGCTKTWSNSSQLHKFAPPQDDSAGLYFFGEYAPSTTIIWEPAHVP